MKPLTVGHLFVFLEEGLELPEHPERAGFADQVLAVLICGQRSHAGARRMIGSRFARLWMIAWGWLVRREWIAFEAEMGRFWRYLAVELERPQSESIAAGGELKAPLCWRLVAMLMSDFGLSRKEALQSPVKWALCLWATEADRRGTDKLASERQIGFRAWVAEQERERLKAEGSRLREQEEGNAS